MKVTSLEIHNIGIIADTKIQLDKPLLLFYGDIRQGKSTVLNAVRWLLGGSFPTDIIRHGEKQAHVELGLDHGFIRREWYRSPKDGTTKARDIEFVRDGKPVDSPAFEIKRLLNPFLINQDHLRNMSELERKRYFADLFAVDTTELDRELFDSERKATVLRAEIKAYGDIDVEKVERVDVEALNVDLAKAKAKAASKLHALETKLEQVNRNHEKLLAEIERENDEVAAFNSTVQRTLDKQQSISAEISQLEARLIDLRKLKDTCDAWLAEHPLKNRKAKPEAPDVRPLKEQILASRSSREVEAIESKLQEASARNVRAEQYERDIKRIEEKRSKEQMLSACEKRQREIKAEKVAKLKTVNESHGIVDLVFDDTGNFSYQGTQAGMLSTSQLMKLSSELSAMYPEGFGLELLDRGESLGRSIFDYVDLAKREEKTILATIVGQRPAQAPPEVGVFVVQDGKVIADATK